MYRQFPALIPKMKQKITLITGLTILVLFALCLLKNLPISQNFSRGTLGFSVLRIWPIFGSVSRFSLLKSRFFCFGALCGLRVFSNFVFGCRFFSTMMRVFRILLPNAFYGFSGFAKEVTPRSHAKTVIPRDHLQLEESMTSLIS